MIAAGHPRNGGGKEQLFAYPSWPTKPQGSRIIGHKDHVFSLMCATAVQSLVLLATVQFILALDTLV